MKTAKEKRSDKARAKRLKALLKSQSFNQSLFSTTAYRHGRKPVADLYYKDMLGVKHE